MSRVLIIEDDPAILRGLTDNLEYASFETLTATDGESGYQLAVAEKPDLIVLDLMLPGMSGYELCRKLRGEGSTVPILMLTARSEEVDRVLGLELGADDYVVKPFSLLEFLARVRALLRRSSMRADLERIFRFGNVELDFQRYEARKAGSIVSLTRKEFGVLHLLISRRGEVVTREELLDEVWGHDSYPTTRTVDNHVATLRAKLEDDPAHPRHVLTVHGVGYKLVWT